MSNGSMKRLFFFFRVSKTSIEIHHFRDYRGTRSKLTSTPSFSWFLLLMSNIPVMTRLFFSNYAFRISVIIRERDLNQSRPSFFFELFIKLKSKTFSSFIYQNNQANSLDHIDVDDFRAKKREADQPTAGAYKRPRDTVVNLVRVLFFFSFI